MTGMPQDGRLKVQAETMLYGDEVCKTSQTTCSCAGRTFLVSVIGFTCDAKIAAIAIVSPWFYVFTSNITLAGLDIVQDILEQGTVTVVSSTQLSWLTAKVRQATMYPTNLTPTAKEGLRTIAFNNPELPPRASLMGMAVETRLQIYGYLLTPTLTDYESAWLKAESHCCYEWFISGNRRKPWERSYLTCKCAGWHIHSQILRASKQTFGEAMPVLYQKMDLHMPMFQRWQDTWDPFHSERRLETDVPTYALQHISSVVIYGKVRDALEKHIGEGFQWWSNIEEHCRLLGQRIPKLRYIRLHLPDVQYDHVNLPACDPFASIIDLPELRSVAVSFSHGFAYNKAVRPEIVRVLKRRAEAVGRTIAVIEQ